MAEKIDMSLDDIIKANKKNPTNKGRPGNRINAANTKTRTPGNNNSVGVRNGTGPVRGGNFNRQNRRQSGPYQKPQNGTNGQLNRSAGQQPNRANGRWVHDKFDGPNLNVNKPGKLSISNLHFRVTDQDLKDLFAEFGKLKSAHVFYDKSGRSLGNAQVIFASFLSAQNAKVKYNNILLDGRKMVINLEGEKVVVSKPVEKPENRLKKPVKRLNNNSQNRIRNFNNNKNSNNRTPGKQKNVPRKKPAPVTQEQLDADLDAYINKQN